MSGREILIMNVASVTSSNLFAPASNVLIRTTWVSSGKDKQQQFWKLPTNNSVTFAARRE